MNKSSGLVALLAGIFSQACSMSSTPSSPLEASWEGTIKMETGNNNPLLDFMYTADPTAVEYNGRLYVYGTNDQQQCDETTPDSDNTYEKINSLAMMSTDDMVNWTYHGLIDTKKLAPWIISSWAPSVCSRVEDDGQTHFYLYFSNSGFGTGVLTSTSPVGPWTSPLEKSVVDANTPGLDGLEVTFDPGVVIDSDGTGYLAFGGAGARLARLSKDMVSFDSPFTVLPARHHFEANELNFIGGRLVYTYNLDWQNKDDWDPDSEVPSICSMAYMLPEGDPLKSESWKYQHHYMRNPGEDGFEYSNNHTHIHKYEGKWYVFGHTMDLKHHNGIKGGYRNIVVEYIDVDESVPSIAMSHYTREGVSQIRSLDPLVRQEFETTAGTKGVFFEMTSTAGNMIARTDSTGIILVKGVSFEKKVSSAIIKSEGEGQIDIHLDSPDGELVASVLLSSIKKNRSRLLCRPEGIHDLVFVFKGESLKLDSWQMFR